LWFKRVEDHPPWVERDTLATGPWLMKLKNLRAVQQPYPFVAELLPPAVEDHDGHEGGDGHDQGRADVVLVGPVIEPASHPEHPQARDLPITSRSLTLRLDPPRTILAAQVRNRFHLVPSRSIWQ
jgi:hypothetical protein